MAFMIGGLFAAGLYLMLRRSIVRIIFGLILMGHAANLLIFSLGRLTRGTEGEPALIARDQYVPMEPFADPLPQALVLTAIVIGFGLQAFMIVLIKRVYQTVKTDDLDAMRTTDT